MRDDPLGVPADGSAATGGAPGGVPAHGGTRGDGSHHGGGALGGGTDGDGAARGDTEGGGSSHGGGSSGSGSPQGDRADAYAWEARHPDTGQRVALWEHNSFDPVAQVARKRRVTEVLDEDGLVLERRHRLLEVHFRHPKEVLRLLAAAGFTVDQVFGGFDAVPSTAARRT